MPPGRISLLIVLKIKDIFQVSLYNCFWLHIWKYSFICQNILKSGKYTRIHFEELPLFPLFLAMLVVVQSTLCYMRSLFGLVPSLPLYMKFNWQKLIVMFMRLLSKKWNKGPLIGHITRFCFYKNHKISLLLSVRKSLFCV